MKQIQQSLGTPARPAAHLPDFATLHQTYPALAEFHERLGNTPVLEVPGPPGGAKILAKCEWENPIGSIKDRIAYALMCDALERHQRHPATELKILEYSGGNLARALAYLGSALGIAMHFVLPAHTPSSLLSYLSERGFQVTLVDPGLGFLGVIETALQISQSCPEWTLLYQHRNGVNPAFHAATTGAELVHQLGGAVPAAWVASIGSGGTLLGVSIPLMEISPRLRLIGVTPAELPYGSSQPPNGLPKYTGATGLGHGLHQPFVKAHDGMVEHRHIARDEALRGMLDLRSVTGLRAGSSAAANWLVSREIAGELTPDDVVVTVFPDAGSPEDWKTACSMPD